MKVTHKETLTWRKEYWHQLRIKLEFGERNYMPLLCGFDPSVPFGRCRWWQSLDALEALRLLAPLTFLFVEHTWHQVPMNGAGRGRVHSLLFRLLWSWCLAGKNQPFWMASPWDQAAKKGNARSLKPFLSRSIKLLSSEFAKRRPLFPWVRSWSTKILKFILFLVIRHLSLPRSHYPNRVPRK